MPLCCLLLAVAGCDHRPPNGGSGSAGPNATSRVSAPGTANTASAGELPAVAASASGSSVLLDGTFHAATGGGVRNGEHRLYSRGFRTWVFAEPRPDAQRLGYLRLGASVVLRTGDAGHSGCAHGWYGVHPRGFVCIDENATLDINDPVVAAMRERAPHIDRKLPYIYGTVRRPGPVYQRVPTVEEVKAEESDFPSRFERWLKSPGESGASYGQRIWLAEHGAEIDPSDAWSKRLSDTLPVFLQQGRFPPRIAGEGTITPAKLVSNNMSPHVGYSILETFLSEGRRYGLTTKFEIVPTDRLRPIQGSDFHGYRIPQDIDFPFAIVRQPGASFFSFDPTTKKVKAAGLAPYRAAIKLTGKQSFFRGRLHYETEQGQWLSDRDASRLDPVKKMPAWGTNGEKWIDINVTKQTLALYEGTKAVYVTLVSTGEAGLSDPEKSTATKRGIYRVHTKHITATMDSDVVGEEFELRDVPYVQYFEANYALHGAYWHDRFGIPKSHGCINLAPEDARRIFFWTEPVVPDGWHGALLPLKGTILFVHP